MHLNKFYRYKHSKILILAFISILASGCGGGGGSSSGSGSSSGDPSSTLVLSNAGGGSISAVLEQQLPDDTNHNLLEQFTRFILPTAWARINVFLNDFSYGSTDQELMIAVTAGSYTLRLVDDQTGFVCTRPLAIGDDQIVTVNIEGIVPDGRCDVTIQRDNVSDDLIAGGDNAPAGKTLACHKNKQIAISFNALDAHLAHGDTAGPCPAGNQPVTDGVSTDDDDDDDGGKPNKPSNPNKPVKT